jgi:hypothetical protein
MDLRGSPEHWYVLRGDRFLGPLPTEAVRDQLARGKLCPQDPAWTRGMSGWRPIFSIAHLTPSGRSPESLKDSLVGGSAPSERPLVRAGHSGPRAPAISAAEPGLPRRHRVVLPVLALASALILGWASGVIQLKSDSGGRPVPGRETASFPWIAEMSSNEYDRLRSVATASPGLPVPAAQIGFSRRWSGHPILYAATVAGTAGPIRARIVGSPETLLSQLRVRLEVSLSPQSGGERLHASEPLQLEGGRGLPPGVYQVTLHGPSGREPLAVHEAFLGGERDQAYLEALRAHHASLRKKSDAELFEFRQLHAALEGQLRGLERLATRKTTFEKGIRPWQAFQQQLAVQIQLPDLPQELDLPFHDRIHGDLSAVLDQMTRLAVSQRESLNSAMRDPSRTADLARIAREISSRLLDLQLRISTAESQNERRTGFPWRE